MELHHRVELIDTLLEEAEQKMSALHHALGVQTRAKEEMEHAGHDTPLSQEGQTLKYEQAFDIVTLTSLAHRHGWHDVDAPGT